MSALSGHFNKIILSPFILSEAMTTSKHIAFVLRCAALNKKAVMFAVMFINSCGYEILNKKDNGRVNSGNVGFANFGSGDYHGSFFLGRRGKIIPYLLYRNHTYVFTWFRGVLTTFLWITRGA